MLLIVHSIGHRASHIQGDTERARTVQPRKERTQEDLSNIYKYLIGGAEKASDRTGNRQKLKHRKFCLNKKTHFSTVGVVEHWERFWSLHLWRYLEPDWTQPWAICCRWPCFEQKGWTRQSTEVPSHLNCSGFMIVMQLVIRSTGEEHKVRCTTCFVFLSGATLCA